MKVSDLVNHLRQDVLRDTAQPFLFPDALLLRYINEGVATFARRTHCLVDEYTLETERDTRSYTLPKGTVFIRQASINDVYLTPFTRRAKPYIFPGKPVAYTCDTAYSSISFYPMPDDVYEVILERVYTPSNLVLSSTIPLEDDWALRIADFVAYRALMNNDADGTQTVSAAGFKAEWELAVRDAKRFYARKAMGENPQAQPRKWT